MLIKYSLIVAFAWNYTLSDIAGLKPTLCAYRNENFQITNTVIGSEQDRKLCSKIEAVHNKTKGTFLADGYERCDDSLGTNHCFTLWVKSEYSDKKRVVKQGCWVHLSKNSSDECQPNKCDSSVAQSLTCSQFSFCCCSGSKCNDGNKHQPDIVQSVPSLQTDAAVVNVNVPALPQVHNPLQLTCAYYKSAVPGNVPEDQNQGAGMVLLDGKTVQCDGPYTFCFSYFELDSVDKSNVTIKYQGCWDVGVSKDSCKDQQCIPYKNVYKNLNNSYFCCCHGNMCNYKISSDYVTLAMQQSTEPSRTGHLQQQDSSYKQRTIVVSLLSVFCVAIIILGVYLAYRFCFKLPQLSSLINNNVEIPQPPAFDIEDLKICCLLVKGRFSEVWKGSLNDHDVAVKIYMPSYRQYYYNEKYIYSLSHIEHENILKFFGGEERILQDGSIQYLLVLQYVPNGTLMNYLKNNTIDWYTMCKMCQSFAKGMAHLHTDIGSGESFKPTVVHRDINSRNVLVKSDLTCVIADLGFCMTTMGSKLIHKGHTENAEQTSVTDVGTLRYMAPELLDGAVNLRDCEASLKQIDMYAFGLVMWEIASRCLELYQGCPMPEFALPYQAEAGNYPTFEEMQLLVSRNKVRPKFPEVWKGYNQAIHALKDTIEECWDHDAEARLTAMCVEERIVDMKMLWSHDNRNKANKGVSPTINTALLSNQTSTNIRPNFHGNRHTHLGGLGSNNELSAANIQDGSASALIINDIYHSTGSLGQGESFATQLSWQSETLGSFSTSTVDTTLMSTLSEIVPSHQKSQNINAMMNHLIPPHQGRNPIVERNTHKYSDEELEVVGKNLFYGKDHNEGDLLSHSENLYDSITDSLETSLMQNDALNHNRHHHVSYVQNRVYSNISGNSELLAKVVNNPDERPDSMSATAMGSNMANSLNTSMPVVKQSREISLLEQLALLGKLAFSGKFDGAKVDKEAIMLSRMENGRIYDTTGRQNPILEPSQNDGRLLSNGFFVRPTNIKLQNINTAVRDVPVSNLNQEALSNSTEINNINSSEYDIQSDSPLISHHRVAPYSKSTSDLSLEKTALATSKFETERKTSRPSTLSLKGHDYTKINGGSLNSIPRFNGVKNPKSGRLSSLQKTSFNGYKIIDQADRPEVINCTGKHEMNDHASKQEIDLHNAQNGVDRAVSRNIESLPDYFFCYSLSDNRLMSNSNDGLAGNQSVNL